MEHLASIIWLFTWPALVFASYFLAKFGLKKLSENQNKNEE